MLWNKVKRVFRGDDGRLRWGWFVAAAWVCYRIWTLIPSLIWLLLYQFDIDIYTWIQKAPPYMQTLWKCYDAVSSAVICIVIIYASRKIVRRMRWKDELGLISLTLPKLRFKKREYDPGRFHTFPVAKIARGIDPRNRSLAHNFTFFAGLGAVAYILGMLIFLALDSARLSPPEDSYYWWGLLWTPLYVISIIAQEYFSRSVIARAAFGEAPTMRRLLLAYIVLIIMHLDYEVFYFPSNYAVKWFYLANMILSTVLLIELARRISLWASIGFHLGWSFAPKYIIGIANSSTRMLSLYTVSDSWLTGSTLGIDHGAYMTIVFCAVIAFVFIFMRDKRNAKG